MARTKKQTVDAQPDFNGELIKAPVNLSTKAKPLRKQDEDLVAKADAALARLSVQFTHWMQDEVEKLSKAHLALKSAGVSDTGVRETFYRTLHDIRGQAETLRFPIAGRVASSLCRLFEELESPTDIPMVMIDQHVAAIRAIVREDARGEDVSIGIQLAQELEKLTDAIVGERSPILDL